MTVWLLILQVAGTGQWIALDVPSRERCEYMLQETRKGGATVTMKNGVKLAIDQGIACITQEEFEANQQAKAGA